MNTTNPLKPTDCEIIQARDLVARAKAELVALRARKRRLLSMAGRVRMQYEIEGSIVWYTNAQRNLQELLDAERAYLDYKFKHSIREVRP